MYSKKLAVLLPIVLLCLNVNAQQTLTGQKYNAITTAVPFLLICPDSRIGGMGETGVAVLNDPNAQHWNPSKYIFSENKGGFSVSYSPWLLGLGVKDIALMYLSAYGKITDMDAVSGSLRFFTMGSMDITNMYGDKISEDKPHEFAFDLTYTRRLIDDLSMSVTGRFIQSKLARQGSDNTQSIKPGLSGAADISLFYTHKFKTSKLKESRLNFGLHISNIGAKVSYSTSNYQRDFLPANFRVGIAYSMKIDDYNQLTFAFDLNKLLVPSPPEYARDDNNYIMRDSAGEPIILKGKRTSSTSVVGAVFTSWGDAPGGFKEEMFEFIQNIGIEYAYNNLFFVRTGLFNEARSKGDRKYMTLGVGLKYSVFSIDGTYIVPLNAKNHPLSNSMRFTISFEFGEKGRR
jgi:hypothetical protein